MAINKFACKDWTSSQQCKMTEINSFDAVVEANLTSG
jgi:hypothetical protein